MSITRETHLSFLPIYFLQRLEILILAFELSHLPNSEDITLKPPKSQFWIIFFQKKEMKAGAVVEEGFIYEEEIQLTVFKTSLFFTGDGFTVYDPKGTLVFRVDSYEPDARDKGELILMDASGRCLLTVRRKVFLHSAPLLSSLRVNSVSQVSI